MFETLTLLTISFILFFTYQNYRLGLTAAVPKDPQSRVNFFCSECLTRLKALLPQATVHSFESNEIHFTPSGQTTPHQLKIDSGQVVIQAGTQPPRKEAFLGPEGSLKFEQLSENALMVTVEARTPEASHRVGLRLEVQFA